MINQNIEGYRGKGSKYTKFILWNEKRIIKKINLIKLRYQIIKNLYNEVKVLTIIGLNDLGFHKIVSKFKLLVKLEQE